MMLKSEAERECIRRWRELPKTERATNSQAAAFAASLMGENLFVTTGDRYRIICGWLERDLLLRGGL